MRRAQQLPVSQLAFTGGELTVAMTATPPITAKARKTRAMILCMDPPGGLAAAVIAATSDCQLSLKGLKIIHAENGFRTDGAKSGQIAQTSEGVRDEPEHRDMRARASHVAWTLAQPK